MLTSFFIVFGRHLLRQCRIPLPFRARAARDTDPAIDRRARVIRAASRICLDVSEYPHEWLREILDETAYQLNLQPRTRDDMSMIAELEGHR